MFEAALNWIGRAGIAGALLGLVFATWVNPSTPQGFVLLVLICVFSAVLFSGIVRLAWRLLRHVQASRGKDMSGADAPPLPAEASEEDSEAEDRELSATRRTGGEDTRMEAKPGAQTASDATAREGGAEDGFRAGKTPPGLG